MRCYSSASLALEPRRCRKSSTYLDSEELIINLKTSGEKDERFRYSRWSEVWDWERRLGNSYDDAWESIEPRTTQTPAAVNDLDDDIPF
jgi:hypothetical protein